MCSFCNQNTITGHKKAPTPDEVENEIKNAINMIKNSLENTEIAFFGGSFTAINKEYMMSLLKIASSYVKEYNLKGIRISTRPDCINREILDILKEYGVSAIELGAQSMVDKILKINFRGHTSKDVVNASILIKRYGFELGLQMMVGLYGESKEDTFITRDRIIALKPDTVRIYPTVILKDTYLEEVYNSGKYNLFSLEESVLVCANLLKDFTNNGIKVIKLGLHSSEDVEKNMVAGIYHQAFRELCESKIYLNNALEILDREKFEKGVTLYIYVNQKAVSKMIGQKKINVKQIQSLGYDVKIMINNSLKEFEVSISQNKFS